MHTVVMPKMGDTMEEGKILSWLKQEGDPVAKGDALAEIETEKVNIEVEAFNAGVLRKILVPASTTVPVGTPIALTGTPDEPLPADVTRPTATAPASAATAPAPPAATADSPLALAHSQGQAAASSETIAPPMTQPAPVAGNGRNTPAANGFVAQAAAPTIPATAGGRIFISPIARRIATEHQLDLTQIPGTGPNGRIIREDIEAALQRGQALVQQPA